jgi:tRNA(fMet)-specific endonuclease VapC
VGALILETTFLVDFEREQRRGRPGPAVAFLEAHQDARLYLTFTILGELAAGASLSEREEWLAFTAPFFVLASNSDVCWAYGRTYLHLQQNGTLIGSNDLWIAATALAHGLPLVTRNVEHYRRVPGLEVIEY